ncbi:hypothetical protein Trydic_g22619 [Trypoxylus dichotomus]
MANKRVVLEDDVMVEGEDDVMPEDEEVAVEISMDGGYSSTPEYAELAVVIALCIHIFAPSQVAIER